MSAGEAARGDWWDDRSDVASFGGLVEGGPHADISLAVPGMTWTRQVQKCRVSAHWHPIAVGHHVFTRGSQFFARSAELGLAGKNIM
jgi:hypothetical protein